MAVLALIISLLVFSSPSFADKTARLPSEQGKAFRSWFLEIVRSQMERGANPRWEQKDCAGLVRFAALEAFQEHDLRWKKANGYLGRALPPDVELEGTGIDPKKLWSVGASAKSSRKISKSSYVSARELAMRNADFVTKDVNEARPGDLLYFDQGEEQHLMIFLGGHIAYHTGKSSLKDDGLRLATVDELLNWKDTRWQINAENSNFRGFYRFSFLAP